ncbi:YaaC family protein [Asaia bogorensis]|uniref:YaaC family protein n=1 Tax=Asaia bogorensis TaxID=91915 RepID=UPI00301A701F
MMDTNGFWDTLSMFESRDFVALWYKNKHSRELNTGGCQAITTCFSQSREYFEAAASAGISVRPLLLYYGVLSMSRGVILLCDKCKKEESLKPSHGIEAFDWGNTLSGSLNKILDIQIKATNGTFSEFANAIGNVQTTGWTVNRHPNFYKANFLAPKWLNDSSYITLDDLLARDPRFLGLYSRTTGRSSKVHLGLLNAKDSSISVSIYSNFSSDDDVRKRFGQPAERPVTLRDLTASPKILSTIFKVPERNTDELRTELPLTQYFHGNGGYSVIPMDGLNILEKEWPHEKNIAENRTFIIEDFPNGDRLSEILRTFLLSYILGMIVRYYPSRWMALLRNEKGDVAQPCLRAISKVVAEDFPRLVVEILVR